MAAEIPNDLKSVKPFFIISKQIEKKNPIVSYHVKMYAVNEGIKTAQDPAARQYLVIAMDQLEKMKSELRQVDDDGITNDEVAKMHLENFADKLFVAADAKDRAAKFDKNLSKTFFTASQIYVTCKQFGELSEEASGRMKYAKWKSVEINRCLTNGITPTPGPPGGFQDEFGEASPGSVQPPNIDQPGPYDGNVGYLQPAPEPTPYSDQPGPSSSYGYQPQPIGFDLPPVPTMSEPSPQPRLPPEIKPVPKPRHEQPPQEFTPQPPPPQQIPAQPPQEISRPPPSGDAVALGPIQVAKAQKLCKFASSALEYDDNPGAIVFLEKALRLLRTGKED